MRVTAGSIGARSKKVGFAQFTRELDELCAIKTRPNGSRYIDRSVEQLLGPDTHSWADIGEAICGRDLMARLRDRRFGTMRGGKWQAAEEAGAGAMGPSQFQAINYWSETAARILEAVQLAQFDEPEFIGKDITTLKPGVVMNIGRRPRYSPPTTGSKALQPNEPIPMGSMDAEWVDVNPLEKHGQGLAIATETMLFDGNQGAAVEAAGKIGYQIGWAKEDRILKPVFGISNTYRYGAADSAGETNSIPTYQTTDALEVAGSNFINKTTVDLTDETSLDTVEQIFLNMKHPRTGYPINMSPTRDILTMPYKIMSARRLSRITTTEQGARAAAPSAVEVTSPTWAGPMLKPTYSQRAMDLMQMDFPDENWTALTANQAKYRFVYGDPRKAFEYREARPFQSWSWNMTQDPSLALHDVFMMVVALEQGSTTVIEPRHVVLGIKDS